MLVEDMTSCLVWLEPARSGRAAAIARAFIKWCALTGAPRVWQSDTAALEVLINRQRRTESYSTLSQDDDEKVISDRVPPETNE